MKTKLLITAVFLMNLCINAQNNAPIIEEFNAYYSEESKDLTIEFIPSDIEKDAMTATLQYTDADGNFQYLDLTASEVDYSPSAEIVSDEKNTWTISNLENAANIKSLRLIVEDDQAFDIQSLVNQVDSNILRTNLELLEGPRSRNADIAHFGFCKDLIFTSFLEGDLNARIQEYSFQGAIGQNLIGKKAAVKKSDTTFIIDGHYDTVYMSPGADDNGSAVVGVMEAVRLLSSHFFEHNIEFIAFDMEEDGLIGSQRYLDRADGLDSTQYVGGVLNFEMIGYWDNGPNTQQFPNGFEFVFPDAAAEVAANDSRGDFITNVGSTASLELMDAFNVSAEQYVPDLKVISLATELSGGASADLRRSDHAYFWDAGYQALMLTDGANFRNPYYHTANDKVETLNFTFMSNVVKATIATMAKIAKIKNATSATTSVEAFPDVTGIENVFSGNVKIYNQNKSAFISFLNPIKDPLDLQLLDLNGKVILAEKISPNSKTHQMSFAGISAGIYLINLSNGLVQFSEKVVVE